MKKSVKTALIVALVLVLAGAAVFGVAWALGARPVETLQSASLYFPTRTVYNYDTGTQENGIPRGFGSQTPVAADGTYTLSAEGVKNLDIDWLSGSTRIVLDEKAGNRITLSESASGGIKREHALKYQVDQGTLTILYCSPGTTGNLPAKDLVITLPAGLADQLDSFKYSSASADLELSGLELSGSFSFESTSGSLDAALDCFAATLSSTSGELSFTGRYSTLAGGSTSGVLRIDSLGSPLETILSSVSGDIFLSGSCGRTSLGTTSGKISGELSASSLAASTTSGDVALAGSLGETEVETTSGQVSLTLTAAPRELEVDTLSGDVELFLPENSGFTLDFDTVSGYLDCAFSLLHQKGDYIAGDGAMELSVETTSGSLRIGKN